MFGNTQPVSGLFGGQPAAVAPTAPQPVVAPATVPGFVHANAPAPAYAPAPAAPSASSLFGGIESARATEGGNYERAGHYIERIKALKAGTSRKGKDFVVFEKEVLQVIDNDGNRGHKVGEDVSHMLTKTGNDSFLGNMKAIFAALANCSVEQITTPICEKIMAEKLVNGLIVECVNRTITTKKGGLFTDIRYRRILTPAMLLSEGTLSPETKARYFPGDVLEKAAAAGRDRP